MEPNTQALEIVCSYFQATHGIDAIRDLRIQKRRAHQQNSRLRKKIRILEESLKASKEAIALQIRVNVDFWKCNLALMKQLQDCKKEDSGIT